MMTFQPAKSNKITMQLPYNHFYSIGDVKAFKIHSYASAQTQCIDSVIFPMSRSVHADDVFFIKRIVNFLFGWLIIFYLSILNFKGFKLAAAFLRLFSVHFPALFSLLAQQCGERHFHFRNYFYHHSNVLF